MEQPVTRTALLLLIPGIALAARALPIQAQGAQAPGESREVTTLQTGWRFQRGSHPEAAQPGFDDSAWESVSVPHDWAIAGPVIPGGDGNTGKLPWQGEGWYRTSLEIPASYSNKNVYLVFDGVMASPVVYVNGALAGKWDYGYNSFYLDVTEHIQPGRANVLAVHADTRQHRSRWYPGAGIYRKVQLLAVDPIHVDVWGTYVTTPIIKPHHADVRIRTTVRNQAAADAEVTVQQVILSPEGREIARGEVKGSIGPGRSRDLEVTIPLNNPRRWDLEDPALYTVRTVVSAGDVIRDTYRTPFGVRTIRFDPDHGFYLNDRRVQLKGVNLHHDHGPLGAAFYPRAMQRQLEIMKSAGVNAIRTSHNVPSPEVAALADSMGLLVIDEIFDKWDGTAGITPATDFEEFAARNVHNWVLRDRNHPSVFLWSVGNEIGDAQWNVNNGFQRLHTMANLVDRYDPSRPVTLVSDNVDAPVRRAFDYYDVLSWNYDRRWRLARQLEPNKPVIISESASTVSTRGFYEFPLPDSPTAFTKSLQVSSYDLHAPEWADLADEDFMWQQDEEYVAGEFVWTGFDYIGEPTPYSNGELRRMGLDPAQASRSSYFGIVDLVGIPKDRYWLYRSYWKPGDTTVHILPHWNWPDRVGKNVPVFVYTSGDCGELFLNGKSQGMKCKNPTSANAIERARLMWNDVVYAPGELRAVAYREGAMLGEATMRTAGEPYEIRLTPDRTTISADGMDLSYVLVEAFDRNGNPSPLADNRIAIRIDEPARIAGVGNGNPQSMEPFQADYIDLFFGKAMLIVRAGHQAGSARITATSQGLRSATTTVRMQ